MRIQEKQSGATRIVCSCGRTFMVKSLGPSVECPHCGRTALSTDLVTAYHLLRATEPSSESVAA